MPAGLSSRLKAQIPSATFVNYDTFKISQINIENNGGERSEEFTRSEELNGKGGFTYTINTATVSVVQCS